MMSWPTMPSAAPRSRGVKRRLRLAVTRGRTWRSKRACRSGSARHDTDSVSRRGRPHRQPTCQPLRGPPRALRPLQVTRRPPARCWATMAERRRPALERPGLPPRPRIAPRRTADEHARLEPDRLRNSHPVPGAAPSEDSDRTWERTVASSAVQRDHRIRRSRAGQRKQRTCH